MSTEAARPPDDITPEAFFTRWLPAQAAAAGAGAGVASGTPLTLRVRLDGEGGGAWDLRLGADGLEVTAASGDDASADVLLQHSVADWRAVVVGEPGAVALVPEGVTPAALFAGGILAQAQANAATVKGTLRFEVTGFNGRVWNLTARFGRQAVAVPPNATVTLAADTYAAILRGELAHAQAFFAGKVTIAGDAGLAMQAAMAFTPRS
jgi:putative sterol carrier protein